MRNSKNNSRATYYAYIEGWVSIIMNICLFILKYWAGVVAGSIAIIADAWHTLSDSLSSIIVLVGAKISCKPADREHPFGHGRADVISAFIIGVLLIVVALDFILESFHTLRNHESSQFGTLAIVVVVISILVKEAMAQYAFWAGRKTNSKVLRADAWHHRSDAISSVIILGGIFLGNYFWWIDGVMGIIVALLIGYAAYDILKKNIYSLLGESPSEELQNDLIQLCSKVYPHKLNLHHFHIHTYGDHTELTFHIRLPQNMPIKKAHDIATNIEEEIKQKYGYNATIHVEPK